jgi:hypothetical protein
MYWPLLLLALLLLLQINSHALMSIGPHAELLLGQGRFTAVYLVSALAGTAASFVLTPAPSVGASGEGQGVDGGGELLMCLAVALMWAMWLSQHHVGMHTTSPRLLCSSNAASDADAGLVALHCGVHGMTDA